MYSILPQSEGYLSYFLLYSSISAFIHSTVCYTTRPQIALKQFSGPQSPPATGLLARVYGTKNVYTSLIRLYAAYNLHVPQLYDLATWTFVGVLFLFVSEMLGYETVRMREAVFPFATAGLGLVWMVLQRDFYVG